MTDLIKQSKYILRLIFHKFYRNLRIWSKRWTSMATVHLLDNRFVTFILYFLRWNRLWRVPCYDGKKIERNWFREADKVRKNSHSQQVWNKIFLLISTLYSFDGFLQRRISERLSECLITRILGKMFLNNSHKTDYLI